MLLPPAAIALVMIAVVQPALEKNPPVPFAGPLDVVARIFGEQWLSFPRYVLSGGFAKAWRGEK